MKRICAFLTLTFVGLLAAATAGAQSPSASSFRQEGIASWYGGEFDGRPTASGEIFDSSRFTAAHRTLPFNTYLIITNTHNNRQVRVRINDRGPFVSPRIIDLSRAAAEAIDMLSTGTAPVIVELSGIAELGPVNPALPSLTAAPAAPVPQAALSSTAAATPPLATPVPAASVPAATAPVYPGTESAAPASYAYPQTAVPGQPPQTPGTGFPDAAVSPSYPIPAAAPVFAPPAPASGPTAASIIGGIPKAGTGKSYRLQIGAYKFPRHAVETFEKLKNAGLNPAYEQNGDIYRVVLAGLRPEEIEPVAEKLMSAGFPEALLREER